MYDLEFMAVGESHGDAICVRYGNPLSAPSVNVIDGGYTSIGDDIVKHIVNVYGTNVVDNVVLTHADDDHARGLIPILQSLDVRALRMNRPWLYVDEFIDQHHGNYRRQGFIDDIKDKHQYLVELEEIAAAKGIPVHPIFAGSRYGAFTVLAPSRARYIELLPQLDKTPEIYGNRVRSMFERAKDVLLDVAESWDYETLQGNPPATTPSNETSLVQYFEWEGFTALLTGDVGPDGLTEAALIAEAYGISNTLKVFQIPHQGSRRNVTPSVLNAWLGPHQNDPDAPRRGVSYCTVGAGKSDHPRRVVSNALRRRGYPVQVGRGQNVLFTSEPRPGFNTLPFEPFHTAVEDYS